MLLQIVEPFFLVRFSLHVLDLLLFMLALFLFTELVELLLSDCKLSLFLVDLLHPTGHLRVDFV